MPSIRFNWRVALVGALALGSILIPQYSSYLGALSAVVQQSPQYNSESPVVSVAPGWGCTHIKERTSQNAFDQ